MAKNVLPKHWNGSEFEELHIVTKASNVFTNDNKSVQQKIDDFTLHLADYTLQVPYAEATGTANTYSVTLNPAPTSLVAGLAIAVKIPVDSTGTSTLNVNGLGAKTIKKANGSDVTNLKAGGIYTLRYDGVNFILQGEGASGNATASDLLSGKTATTDAGEIVGTIPIKGAATITPGTTNQVIAAGQYLSGPQTILGDPNLIPANIISGKSIFGVAGSVQPGKKFATGTIAGSASSLSFLTPGETSINMIYVTVSGLTFLPSVIMLVYTNETYNHFRTAIYSKYGFGLCEGSAYYDTGKIIVTDKSGGHSDPSPWPRVFKLAGNAYVNATGFRLPISSMVLMGNNVTWYAWE